MKSEIIKRVMNEAYYIIKTEKTIREIAQNYNISKSTIHKDLHERLKSIDKNLYSDVDKILKYHLDIRHIRGGEATRKKFSKLKENIN